MTIPILFLLASLGVVNGLLVSGYLLVKRQSSIADRYFGALLLTLCIRIGKSIFFYFNRDTDPLILQIGLSFCILIGPFFYLYIKSLRTDEKRFLRYDLLLLIALSALITIVGIIYPYRTFP
ncbi:MAG: AraC family transcriptional regulator, partial [Bacteroidota bacterium]